MNPAAPDATEDDMELEVIITSDMVQDFYYDTADEVPPMEGVTLRTGSCPQGCHHWMLIGIADLTTQRITRLGPEGVDRLIEALIESRAKMGGSVQ